MPNKIYNLYNLEKLTINSHRFKKVPKEFGYFPNLKELTIIAKKIKKIPNEIYDKVEVFNIFEISKYKNLNSKRKIRFNKKHKIKIYETDRMGIEIAIIKNKTNSILNK